MAIDVGFSPMRVQPLPDSDRRTAVPILCGVGVRTDAGVRRPGSRDGQNDEFFAGVNDTGGGTSMLEETGFLAREDGDEFLILTCPRCDDNLAPRQARASDTGQGVEDP